MSRVTYEITATVSEELRQAYETYLIDRHIPDLMATGAFAEATIGRSSSGRYRIRYEAFSRGSLNEYLRAHAANLRADHLDSFPNGVELSRDEWEVLERFVNEP